MAFWNRTKPEEERAITIESFGAHTAGQMLDMLTSDPVVVTTKKALGVPAIWAAVNFISNSLSTVPLQLFERLEDDGRRAMKGDPLYGILHDAPNIEWTAPDFWKYLLWQALTGGRGLAYIERARNNRVINLWPLDPMRTEAKKVGMRRQYLYREDDGQRKTYESHEILDIVFALDTDQISALSPIFSNRESVGLSIVLQEYANKLFLNGGVPPLSLEGPFKSPEGVQRAAEDVTKAIQNASKQGRQVLPMPLGHALKALGINPEQGQLIEARRFQLEEAGRMYGLPPVFLQDLTNGTYSNTEQQDLQVVKHSLSQWAERVEAQINLKLFGRPPFQRFAEFNLDGLLRGDFKTRMEGYSKGIQNSLFTPNESRQKENLPPMEGGDNLMIQQNMTNVTQLGDVNGNGT